MKRYTVTFRRRGSATRETQSLFACSLIGAEIALVEWEGDILILSTKEAALT